MSRRLKMIDMFAWVNLYTRDMVLLLVGLIGLVVMRQSHTSRVMGTGMGICLYIQGAY